MQKDFLRIVGESTHLRLSVFTHLIVGRFLAGARNLVFVETTLALLQYVSIIAPQPDFGWAAFHDGDENQCQLF